MPKHPQHVAIASVLKPLLECLQARRRDRERVVEGQQRAEKAAEAWGTGTRVRPVKRGPGEDGPSIAECQDAIDIAVDELRRQGLTPEADAIGAIWGRDPVVEKYRRSAAEELGALDRLLGYLGALLEHGTGERVQAELEAQAMRRAEYEGVASPAKDAAGASPPSGASLTELMTIERLAHYFEVSRNTMADVLQEIPGVQRHGGRYRVPVWQMPPKYLVEHGLSPRA